MEVERCGMIVAADDPDRQHDGGPVMQFRYDRVEESGVPVRRCNDEFPQVADADYTDERGNHQFEWPKASLVQMQNRERRHARDAQPAQQREHETTMKCPMRRR